MADRFVVEKEADYAVYLCRRCWAVVPAKETVVWDHTCHGLSRRFVWSDRTDFRYLHNRAVLESQCPCCKGTGRVATACQLGAV